MNQIQAIKEADNILNVKQQLELDLFVAGYENVRQHPDVIKLQQQLDILRTMFY